MKRLAAAACALGIGIGGWGTAWAATEPASGPEECFAVADGTPDATDGQAPDLLTRVSRSATDVETNETDVGTGTGTSNMEAIALQPGTGVLFAADAGTIGTIDQTTGRFTALGAVGTASGAAGEVEIDDVDGLTFDPATGFLYGSHRIEDGEDLLLRIDPAAGAFVAGALGGADYVTVPAVANLPDIDDLAIDPVDSRMYAVANDNGRRDHLILIDKLTGQTTDIGVMEAQDVEGLGFASGQLIGTTGKNRDQEGIWDIDKATGGASNRRALDNGRDYEGFDCLNPPTVAAPAPPVAPPVAPPPAEVLGITEEFPQPVAQAASAPPPAPLALPAQLPRTGPAQALPLLAGSALALGGLGVIGGARRTARGR